MKGRDFFYSFTASNGSTAVLLFDLTPGPTSGGFFLEITGVLRAFYYCNGFWYHLFEGQNNGVKKRTGNCIKTIQNPAPHCGNFQKKFR